MLLFYCLLILFIRLSQPHTTTLPHCFALYFYCVCASGRRHKDIIVVTRPTLSSESFLLYLRLQKRVLVIVHSESVKEAAAAEISFSHHYRYFVLKTIRWLESLIMTHVCFNLTYIFIVLVLSIISSSTSFR